MTPPQSDPTDRARPGLAAPARRTPRLARAFATVGGWTMASRILGFVRDVTVAALLGAGPAAQAFVAAFTLPNLFRRFFAEGAFNTAFVPMFARRLEAEGPDAAREFAETAMAALAAVLLALTLLAQLAMPWLVLALTAGFAGDDRLPLAVEMGRIAFPYILFISLAALLSGVLNSLGRFATAAAAPVLLNLILIGALALAATGALEGVVGLETPAANGHAAAMLTWGVAAAGIAQLALVWRAAAKAGMPLRLRRPRFTPALWRLAVVALPAALAGGVMQINLVVGRQAASFFEGAVAWLYYADRLYQLPLGVIGVAVGVVLLPELARRAQAGDHAGAREAANRSAEFALALTLPAAVALAAVPETLVEVLFGRGAFGAEDARATALAVSIYGLGLPAFVLQKIYQPLFFAREDTRTPFRCALWGMGVNAAVALGLAPVIGFTAAAWATTLSAWLVLALLVRAARVFGEEGRIDARLARRLPRLALASLGMGALCLGLEAALAAPLALAGWRWAALGALVAGGAAGYGALAWGLGALRPAELKAALRRG
ncbi:MAG: murein biosynthesis integral membrane protein MurJ [Paracoccaceae bacterium]